jgi:hypothetical protein
LAAGVISTAAGASTLLLLLLLLVQIPLRHLVHFLDQQPGLAQLHLTLFRCENDVCVGHQQATPLNTCHLLLLQLLQPSCCQWCNPTTLLLQLPVDRLPPAVAVAVAAVAATTASALQSFFPSRAAILPP